MMDEEMAVDDGSPAASYPEPYPMLQSRPPYPGLSWDAEEFDRESPSRGQTLTERLAAGDFLLRTTNRTTTNDGSNGMSNVFHGFPESTTNRGFQSGQLSLPHDGSTPNSMEIDRQPHPSNEDNAEEPPQRGRGRGRGRSRGRGRGDGTTRGEGRRRGRGWKALLKGTDHADIFAKPKTPRGKTGKKRGRKPGRPKTSVNATGIDWLDPGEEFRELQRKATTAYLDGNLDDALDFAKMAVEKNSEVFMAHKMIHDIYQQQGKERDALLALAVGVNTMRDPELWCELGERLAALGQGELDWAMDCFSEAIKLRKENYRARIGKSRVYEQMQKWDHARYELRVVFRKFPGDLDLVNHYAELCVQSGNAYEWEKAQWTYERAFQEYADQDMLGDDPDQQWVHLNDYMGLLLRRGLFDYGIKQLKKLARWFLGRKQDVFWDEEAFKDDDREFDSTHERRMGIWQFQQGLVSLEPAQYGDGLPLELRVKLGLCRLNTNKKAEAMKHFEWLLRDDVEVGELEDMFYEVGQSFQARGHFADASRFYEPTVPFQDDRNSRFWHDLAKCYIAVDRKEDAERCLVKVNRADPVNIESRMQLARIYDSTGQCEKSFQLVEEVEAIGKRPVPITAIQPPANPIPQRPLPVLQPKPANGAPAVPAAGVSTGPVSTIPSMTPMSGSVALQPKKHLRTKNVRRSVVPKTAEGQAQDYEEKRVRVVKSYEIVKELRQSIEAGTITDAESSRFLVNAQIMATAFRSIHRVYSNNDMAHRATKVSHLPHAVMQEMERFKKRALGDYHTGAVMAPYGPLEGRLFDIPAVEWHWILSELALLYAKRVKQDECYQILQNGLIKPLVFRQNLDLMNTTQAVCLSCALLFNDTKFMTDVARDYITRSHKQSNEAFQFLAATARLSHGADPYFYDKKTSKWLFDLAKDQPANAVDPILLALAGQTALHTKHANGRSPLPYLLQALALAPTNITINLTLASMHITLATRATTTDRHRDINQGLAFFQRYYDLRVASGAVAHRQEAEFNRARLWHQLGLTLHAVPAYQRVLELSAEVRRELLLAAGADLEDFTAEAAYALQRIYSDAGNEEAARTVGERWLVME